MSLMVLSSDELNPPKTPGQTRTMPAPEDNGKRESGVRSHLASDVTSRDIEAVTAFGNDMRKKLHQNANKGGWRGITNQTLLKLLVGELQELIEALEEGTPDEIRDECADIGNFAMMIHDNAGR